MIRGSSVYFIVQALIIIVAGVLDMVRDGGVRVEGVTEYSVDGFFCCFKKSANQINHQQPSFASETYDMSSP